LIKNVRGTEGNTVVRRTCFDFAMNSADGGEAPSMKLSRKRSLGKTKRGALKGGGMEDFFGWRLLTNLREGEAELVSEKGDHERKNFLFIDNAEERYRRRRWGDGEG